MSQSYHLTLSDIINFKHSAPQPISKKPKAFHLSQSDISDSNSQTNACFKANRTFPPNSQNDDNTQKSYRNVLHPCFASNTSDPTLLSMNDQLVALMKTINDRNEKQEQELTLLQNLVSTLVQTTTQMNDKLNGLQKRMKKQEQCFTSLKTNFLSIDTKPMETILHEVLTSLESTNETTKTIETAVNESRKEMEKNQTVLQQLYEKATTENQPPTPGPDHQMILDQLSIILQSLSSSSKKTTPTICMDSSQAEPLVLMEEEASFAFPTIKSTIPMNSFQIDAIDQNEYYITPGNKRKSQISTYRSKNKSKSKPESKSLIITKNRPKRKAYLEAMQWIRCDMKIFNNQKTSYASPIRRHSKKKLIRQRPVLSSVTDVIPCENDAEQCVASNASVNNTIMLVRSVTKTNQQFDALVLSTTKSITNTKKIETLPTQIEEDCSTNQMIKHKFGKNTNLYSSYSNNSFYL